MRLRRREQGSVLILVLGMLSILILIAAALSYTARLESTASNNFAQGTQARISAATGLPFVVPWLRSAMHITSPLQAWNRPISSGQRPAAQSADKAEAATRPEDPRTSSPASGEGQAIVQVTDLSSKVNINAITSDYALGKFLSVAFTGSQGSSAHPTLMSRAGAIFQFRGTPAGKRDRIQPDLRRAAPQGTRRFESVSDLKRSRKGAPGLFSEKEFKVLSEQVTVFSQAPEVFNGADEQVTPKLSLANLTVDAVYDQLRRAYPKHDPRLLMQFACNVADYADVDDVPTLMVDPDHREPWNTVIGIEQTPFITEVYPDATTREREDDGQFVEISNPWAKPMSLGNWRLVVGGGGTGTTGLHTTLLNAIIPPGGTLVITNNYDHPAQDSPPETGSFLSIFGRRSDGNARKILEDAGFDLPDRNSFVTLLDGNGRMVDIFSYTAVAGDNSKSSYQRDDPRVRAFKVTEASPFEKPVTGTYTGSGQSERDMRAVWVTGNLGLVSPVELLHVSTAYAGLRASGDNSVFSARPWQMPSTRHESAQATTNLDSHLLDLFTTVIPPEMAEETGAEPNDNRQVADDASEDGWLADADKVTSDGILYSYGKLNLNTCSRAALYSIDARISGRDYLTPDLIAKIDGWRKTEIAANRTPFNNVSDLLALLFPEPDDGQLRAFARIMEQVSVNSSSFEIVADNRVSEAALADTTRRPSAARMVWQIALDSQPCSVVSCTLGPGR